MASAFKSVFFKTEEENKIKESIRKKCRNCSKGVDRECSVCTKLVYSEWKQHEKKATTWEKYPILDEGVSYPSTMRDVERLEENYRSLGVKIHIFTKFGDFIYKTYSGSTLANKDVKKNIHILKVATVSKDQELLYHFTGITNHSAFVQKTYFGLTGNTRSLSNTTACDFCSQLFYDTKKNGEKVTLSNLLEDFKKNGLGGERANLFLTHLENCKCDRLTREVFPDHDFLEFKNFSKLIEPTLTCYADLETCNNRVQGQLCNLCLLRYNNTTSPQIRDEILINCRDHSDYNISPCDKCFTLYAAEAGKAQTRCNREDHEKMIYKEGCKNLKYILCIECHHSCVRKSKCQCIDVCTKKCESKTVCEHGGVRKITDLKPLTVGLIVVSNYECDDEYLVSTSAHREKVKKGTQRSIIVNQLFEGDNCIRYYKLSFSHYLLYSSATSLHFYMRRVKILKNS